MATVEHIADSSSAQERWISNKRPSLTKRVKQFLRGQLEWAQGVSGSVINAFYDWFRFVRWSGICGLNQKEHVLMAWLRADFHKLEKGLALPVPKPGFGKFVFERLALNLATYHNKGFRLNSCDTNWGRGVVQAYIEFQKSCGVTINKDQLGIVDSILNLELKNPDDRVGGLVPIKKGDILEQSGIDFESFANSRFSIRQFDSDKLVDRKLLEKAVDISRKTPSVCNRQTVRVHLFDDPSHAREVIKYQKGNSGFGHTVPALAVITSDIANFFSPAERNQMWIDGGLFSMSFAYALHSLGLGSCCLNWSVSTKVDKEFRASGYIPENENVIMMIAIGHLPENLEIAASPRLPVETIATFHSARD